MAKFLQGFIIGVPQEDESALDAISRFSPLDIKDAGGELVALDAIGRKACTHVLANRSDEQHAVWASDHRKHVVTPLWLYECMESRTCLNFGAEKLYNGKFHSVQLPNNTSEFTVTTTAYQGFRKWVYGRMLQSFGLTCTKTMNPKSTDAVIAGNVEELSPKIDAAHANAIPVVNVLWLYDSIRQNKILPTEDYSRNPPSSMDPFQGAIARDAVTLEVVANSGSSEDDEPFDAGLVPQTEAVNDWGPGSGLGDLLPKPPSVQEEPYSDTAVHADLSHGADNATEDVAGGPPLSELRNPVRSRDPSKLRLSTANGGQDRTQPGLDSGALPSRPNNNLQVRRGLGLLTEETTPQPEETNQQTKQTAQSYHPLRLNTLPPATDNYTLATTIKSGNGLETGVGASTMFTTCNQTDPRETLNYATNTDMARESAPRKSTADLLCSETGLTSETRKSTLPGHNNFAQTEARNIGAPIPDNTDTGTDRIGRPFENSMADMSQQIADANANIGLLVDHLMPDDSLPLDDFIKDATAKQKGSELEGSKNAGERVKGKIPVVDDVPLASQLHEELEEGNLKDGIAPPPKRQRQNTNGVSWRAEPIGRRKKAVSKLNEDEGEENGDGSKKRGHGAKKDEEDTEQKKPSAKRRKTAVKNPVPKGKKNANAKRKEEDESEGDDEKDQPEGNLNDKDRIDRSGTEDKEKAASCREWSKAVSKRAVPQKAQSRKVKRKAKQSIELETPIANDKNKEAGKANKARSINKQGSANQPSRDRFKKRSMFSVSGMHSKQRDEVAEQLRSLGQAVSLNLHSHNWDNRITHILLPKDWVRGAKVLAGMAAGAWFLRDDYMRDSSKSHQLLDEEDYEISTNKKGTIAKDACKHWRLARKLTGKSAFEGLKVGVYGEFEEDFRPCKSDIVSILQAGNAKLLTVNQAQSAGAHFIVTKQSRSAQDGKVKQFLAGGLCVVSPKFVVDWIAFPSNILSKYVFKGSQMKKVLKDAMNQRSQLPTQNAPSSSMRMNASAPSPEQEKDGESESEDS